MNNRVPSHAIDPIFVDRWSPRAFDPRPMDQTVLDTLLEAARWAPSAYNYQPWRFLYAHRDDAHWQDFMSALIPFNQSWAANASVLLYVVSDTLMEMKPGEANPNHCHSFDAGAAWMSLALQAARSGLYAHGMSGVDFDAARKVLDLPDRFRPEAAVAIGYRGDPAGLAEHLREREAPSARKPLNEIGMAGRFVG